MTNVLEVFKVLMGLIISIFVLYFLVSYAGNYAGMQSDTQRAKILRNFDRLSQDVYYTGIPTDYNDFSLVSWPSITVDPTPPAGIVTSLGKSAFSVPTLFSYGERMVMSKATEDFGWWKFSVVEAMPPKRVVLNVEDSDDAAWDTVRSLVIALPSTLALDNKVTFAFCDGNEIIFNLCGEGVSCEKDYFLPVISKLRGSSGPCTAALSGSDMLVTFARTCSPGARGLCVETPNPQGIGNAYLQGSEKPFIYKDGLDLAALLIGGSGSDIFGLGGEKLWKHKNRAFADDISLAADIAGQSALLLSRRITDEIAAGRLSPDAPTAGCRQLYTELKGDTDTIKTVLENPDYYIQFGEIGKLKKALDDAKSVYLQLQSRGCEYL